MSDDKAVVASDAAIDELLEKLDDLARDYDDYAYGLPMDTDNLALMRDIVRAWLTEWATK